MKLPDGARVRITRDEAIDEFLAMAVRHRADGHVAGLVIHIDEDRAGGPVADVSVSYRPGSPPIEMRLPGVRVETDERWEEPTNPELTPSKETEP